MRAHIICTAAMSGHVISDVQRSPVPSCAPAMEYVAIPEGSSSAAPVISPGPRESRNRAMRFCLRGRSLISMLDKIKRFLRDRLGDESVSDPRLGDEVARIRWIGFELPPQCADMHAHRVVGRR